MITDWYDAHPEISVCTFNTITALDYFGLLKRPNAAGKRPLLLADTSRLNWLDEVNRRANERNGTVYGWRFDINHNRAALTDHNLPALTIRQAIDEAMKANKVNGETNTNPHWEINNSEDRNAVKTGET
jgi:hypothetical protein